MFNFSNNAKKKERKKKRQCNLLETEVHLDSGKHRVYSLRVWKKKNDLKGLVKKLVRSGEKESKKKNFRTK